MIVIIGRFMLLLSLSWMIFLFGCMVMIVVFKVGVVLEYLNKMLNVFLFVVKGVNLFVVFDMLRILLVLVVCVILSVNGLRLVVMIRFVLVCWVVRRYKMLIGL